MAVNPIKLNPISANKFEILAGLSRQPRVRILGTELEYYSNENETHLGVILIDHADKDFVALILARDEQAKFSCFESAAFSSLVDARGWLFRTIKWHTGTGRIVHEQGRESRKPLDLFTPVVSCDRQHTYYQKLVSHQAFSGARKAIAEMMPHYTDVDGNFIQQFQSDGFDARVWELYLFALLKESGFDLDRSHAAPDFTGNLFGYDMSLEAVIVGRPMGHPVSSLSTMPQLPSPAEIEDKLKNEMPIRFGSPLYSKLKKRYWEMDHVKGKPFVLAIADFHDDQSMIWSSSALHAYLYGRRYEVITDSLGSARIVWADIASHTQAGKTIPSCFFDQPDTENISAVLTTASGTISKFNRMGRQAGYGHPGIKMIRKGYCVDHNPKSFAPKKFVYEVNESTSEKWSEGVNIYHNPNAKVPLDQEVFPLAGHHVLKDGEIVSIVPDFHPFASWTINLCPRGAAS